MIASQLGRAVRASSIIHTCTAHRTAAAASISAASSSLPCSRSLHQRRPSSSKASCPPDDGPNGARSAATAQQAPTPARTPTSRNANGRQVRTRKAAKKADQVASDERAKQLEHEATFSHLPSVPTTSHMHRADITLASFFSLHRPLSLKKPMPTPADQSVFERIFEPATQENTSEDVIYTLSNTIETIEKTHREKGQGDLHWQVVQESASNNAEGVRHLDGQQRTKSIEEIVASLKPFSTPPPPLPIDEAKQAKKQARKSALQLQSQAHNEQQQDRTFKTTLFLSETTGSDGAKYYTAQATPVVQIPNAVHDISEPQHGLTEIREQRQPFLDRMRQRQWRYMEYREDRVQRQEDERLAISVKRQRKLKMKKHKYKKLMKRTRNLRRRLDRN